MNTTLLQAPDLAIDATMLAMNPRYALCARQRTERALVWNLLAHLDAAGFKLYSLSDGEERTKLTDHKEAMELVFNLDECWLHVRKMDSRKAHTIYIVLGNDGWDAIADHSCCAEDGFDAAMESFDVEQFA